MNSKSGQLIILVKFAILDKYNNPYKYLIEIENTTSLPSIVRDSQHVEISISKTVVRESQYFEVKSLRTVESQSQHVVVRISRTVVRESQYFKVRISRVRIRKRRKISHKISFYHRKLLQ